MILPRCLNKLKTRECIVLKLPKKKKKTNRTYVFFCAESSSHDPETRGFQSKRHRGNGHETTDVFRRRE